MITDKASTGTYATAFGWRRQVEPDLGAMLLWLRQGRPRRGNPFNYMTERSRYNARSNECCYDDIIAQQIIDILQSLEADR